MLFHTLSFLGFFFVVFSVYWKLQEHRNRMLWLLAASCFFYMSWKPLLILLILFSASIDFIAAQWMEATPSARTRKHLLIASITLNLSLLAYFKYMNFFLDSVYTFIGWFGWEGHHTSLKLLLPLGISFYTFETISYIVDVYNGRIRAERNLLDYSLYILFFPHLIAGPIVRPRDFLPQLRHPKRFSATRCYLGVRLIMLGLFKKAILADQLARVVDPIFANPGAYNSAMLWLAVFGYSLQIYCDFSGYSGMAIGLAHMLGFKLPANFNLPYLAANITEFWRRWHISLSNWLRDYLYIPLGGNRLGTLTTYRNLILTMLLGGLWHGANWTFVVWGLYHGVLLAIHRMIPKIADRSAIWFRPIGILCTFLLVSIGWVFFRAQTFGDALTVLSHLFQPIGGMNLPRELIAIGVACLIVLCLGHVLAGLVSWDRLERRLPAPVVGVALAALLFLTQLLFPFDGRAFIYFQF